MFVGDEISDPRVEIEKEKITVAVVDLCNDNPKQEGVKNEILNNTPNNHNYIHNNNNNYKNEEIKKNIGKRGLEEIHPSEDNDRKAMVKFTITIISYCFYHYFISFLLLYIFSRNIY